MLIRDAPGGMRDVVYRQETMVTSSMRPIVHQVWDRELTLLAEMAYAIDQLGIPRRAIKQARVDSLLLQPGTRKMQQAIDLPKLTYQDLCYDATIFSAIAWKQNTSGAQVLKAEVLPHESRSIIGQGDVNPQVDGFELELCE